MFLSVQVEYWQRQQQQQPTTMTKNDHDDDVIDGWAVRYLLNNHSLQFQFGNQLCGEDAR